MATKNIQSTKSITVDVYDSSAVVIRAKQYDKLSRYINITFTNCGEPLTITADNCKALVKVITPDNRAIQDICTIANGIVTVELTDSILSYPGVAYMDVNLYSKETSGGLLTSMTIKLVIEQSVYDDDREIKQSGDEFSALTNLISEVTTLEGSVEKAEAARVTAENSRVAAEKARVSAESARVSAENSRVSAEKARVTAESNRVTEFNTLKSESETATAAAEKVNISSTSSTNSYTITITNRNGTSSTSPNLLNKLSIGTVTDGDEDTTAAASITGNHGSQKLNLTLKQGKHGYGFYRYNGTLSTSATSCTRTNIMPSTGKLYTSETIIDESGNIFAVTADYTSGTSVSIENRTSWMDYMTVAELAAMMEG